jgi:hypothetical protein
MMAWRPDRLSPGKTVALFVAVAAVSVTALVWMGGRLLTQERALGDLPARQPVDARQCEPRRATGFKSPGSPPTRRPRHAAGVVSHQARSSHFPGDRVPGMVLRPIVGLQRSLAELQLLEQEARGHPGAGPLAGAIVLVDWRRDFKDQRDARTGTSPWSSRSS